MDKRSGNIELARFIAALLIMAHHLYLVLPSNYPFQDSWIYVEFFLIITGYYTTKHFDGISNCNGMKEAIIYTFKKFIPIFPYIIVATIGTYLISILERLTVGEQITLKMVGEALNNFIFEVLMISESYTHPLVNPLWYLSSMFILFPLFSRFVQIKNRYWILLIASIYPLFYYGYFGINGNRDFPHDFLRVIAGLCMGAFVYEFNYIFNNYMQKINKTTMAIVEGVAFIIPIILNYNNLAGFRFILFCFIVCLTIMLPGYSYSGEMSNELIRYLGKLSMPIFVFHWLIGKGILFVVYRTGMDNCIIRTVLYYGLTIIVSIIGMHLINHWTGFQNILKNTISLED